MRKYISDGIQKPRDKINHRVKNNVNRKNWFQMKVSDEKKGNEKPKSYK